MDDKEAKLVSAMAHAATIWGAVPPTYKKPKWYQFGLKRKLAFYRKHNWPYRIVG